MKLPRGLLFSQTALITPSFNITNAYSAMATAGLLFPTYKRLGFTVGTVDDFLNDPAIGSKRTHSSSPPGYLLAQVVGLLRGHGVKIQRLL